MGSPIITAKLSRTLSPFFLHAYKSITSGHLSPSDMLRAHNDGNFKTR